MLKSAFIFVFSVILFIFPLYAKAYSIDDLLATYAQKADLSNRTKKESAGYLIVFTRQDLDRMKIKSLSEIINYIPFLRYNENESGLTELIYNSSYQSNIFNSVIVYLNNRELITPFNGNGLQLIGQMDTDYIDHIEIYMGLPSYEIGLHTGTVVIKIYTKKGYRENSTVLGTYYGSRNTNSQYIYQGKQVGDLSYFVYLNRKQLNRSKSYLFNKQFNKNYSFSKNKNTVNFYGEVENNNIRLETQAVFGSLDNFIGKSWDMTTTKDKTRFNYVYAGIYYKSDKKDFRASLNYSETYTDNTQISDGPLGVIPLPSYPFFYIYRKLNLKMREKLSDLKISKEFKAGKNSLLLGGRFRYKGFKFTTAKVDDRISLPSSDYNREFITTAYAENHYFINPKNIIVLSAKLEKHFENGGIRDFNVYGGRLGYIFNNKSWTFKNFIFAGNFTPTPYVLYYQNLLGKKSPDPIKGLTISSEITYRHNSSIYSVLLMDTELKNYIYYGPQGYYFNDRSTESVKGFSLKYTYNFDPFNKIILNGWYARLSSSYTKNNLFGGFVALFNKWGKFNFFNSLSYRGIYTSPRPAFNLNTTVTFNASDNFEIYLKGTNLLNRGIETNYFAVNPLTKSVTDLNNVKVFDRTIMIGMEYKF